jgi:hypothetical protein
MGLTTIPDPRALGLATMLDQNALSLTFEKKRMGLTWLLGLDAWVKNKIKKY